MGYYVFVQRGDDPSCPSSLIEASEFSELVEASEALSWDPNAPSGLSWAAFGEDDRLWLEAGVIQAKSPSVEAIAFLIEIAASLKAKLFGEDGTHITDLDSLN